MTNILHPHQTSVVDLRDWPILLTKLLRPLPPEHHVRRERLEHRFENHQKHWCIYGSAGYGKTTLASAYCDSLNTPIGWLSLDAEDNAPERFALYLAATFVSAYPQAGKRFSASARSTNGLDLKQIVTAILNEALLTEQHITLVIDDYHLINTQLIHDNMSLLLNQASTNLQLLILSRTRPPLKLSTLQMNNRICSINTSDLAFEEESCVAYLAAVCPHIEQKVFLPMLKTIEGWPAGIRSLALFLEDFSQTADLVSSESLISSGIITDYLWEQVLGKLTPELQQFLLQTAIFDTFDAELGNAITGQENSIALIEDAVRRQLFIVALDPERRWYRYHNLFQAFLNRHLQDKSANDFELLHRRAAECWLARYDVSKALEHALSIKATDLIVRALNHPHQELIIQGNRALLQRTILSLSNETICQHPKIMMLACRYWMVRNRDNVMQLTNIATELIDQITDNSRQRHIRALIELYRAQIAFRHEQIDTGMSCALRALEYLTDSDFRSRSEVNIILAEAHTRSGNIETAREYWQISDNLAQQSGTHSLVVWSRHQLAMLELGAGSFSRAVTLQNLTISYGERHSVESAHSLWCLYRARAEIAWEYFNLDDVNTLCDKALRTSQLWFHDGTVPILIIRARAELLLGHQNEAHELLLQAESVLKTSSYHSYVQSYLDLAFAELHLRYSPPSAIAVLAHRLVLPTSFNNEITQRQGRVMAICRIGQDDAAGAMALLDTINIDADRIQLVTEKWHNDIWRVVCQLMLDQHDQAETTLQTCLQFAADQGLIGSMLMAMPLIDTLLGQKIELDKVQSRHLQRLRDLLGHSRAHQHGDLSVPAAMSTRGITPREWRVFEQLLNGSGNEEIAARLHLSLGTVKNTLTRIYRKLDITDREAACRIGNQILL